MLLELGKFVSLLLSILCFCALFHAAFLMPVSGFSERILEMLKMLALAGSACWVSGWIFRRWEQKLGCAHATIAGSLPMKVFWWGSGGIAVIFTVVWYLEAYYLPLRSALAR